MIVTDQYIERLARSIVGEGGQILLNFDAGDAEVIFPSRRHLRDLIVEALKEVRTYETQGGMIAVMLWSFSRALVPLIASFGAGAVAAVVFLSGHVICR